MDEWKKEILRKWEDVHDAPDDVIRGLIIDDVEKYLIRKIKSDCKFHLHKIERMKKDIQKDLGRIAGYSCNTPEKAIEQRVLLEQVHVTLTYIDRIINDLKHIFKDIMEVKHDQ